MLSVCGGGSGTIDPEKPNSIESLRMYTQLKWQVISSLHDIDDDGTLLQYQNGYTFFVILCVLP